MSATPKHPIRIWPVPGGIEVRDSQRKWLATFTKGAYTAGLAGPKRSFTEKEVSITHSTWVRTLPKPFDGKLDKAWLSKALKANKQLLPDILTLSMQYVRGAPAIHDGDLQIAGDARYGPLVEGKRQEGSDFNDYLGLAWTYSREKPANDEPEIRQFRCLDCSGFIRMIWGYRRHAPNAHSAGAIPLCRKPRADRSAIPRRAFQICESAPGVLIIGNTGKQITDFSKLSIGDIVLFDADAGDGSKIDHIGMYLGLDAERRHRFISSRKGANGPTLSDYKGKSVLDGSGLYAKSFRAVRRL